MTQHNELTFAQIMPFVLADLKEGLTPALLGEPGIGKSSFLEDLVRINKTKVFTLPVNQLGDKADLTGLRSTLNKDTGKYSQEAFPHSIIAECIAYAERFPDEEPILFLDEFNRASSDITSSILSFQTLRKIGTVEFPDNMRIVVAGNDKGNVTSLDGASISRFSVYRVRPDLETFLSVQTLNAFVTDVLAKHPEDLMADESVNIVATTEDEEDSKEDFAMAEFSFMSEDNFKQITRPRTITYTSKWLNAMGIDKSGSDTEKQILAQLFTDMSSDNESNVLLSAIEAHVGQTTFAYHLFDEIREYFGNILTATHSSNQPKLQSLRPKQDVINALSRVKGVADVEDLIASLDKKVIKDTLIWLTENESVKEINNNSAVMSYMITAPYSIDNFEREDIANFMAVLPSSTNVSEASVEQMLKSNAPFMDKWRPVFKSVLGTE